MEKGALWSKKDSLTDEDRENIQFCFEYMSKIFKAKLLDTIVLGSIDTFWLEYFFTKHTLQGWELSPVTLMNLKDGSLGVDIERILLRNGLDPTLVD
jgi:hypothetical protein